MKSISPLLLLLLLLPARAGAQSPGPDTIYRVYLRNFDVNADRRWANDTARYRYHQMRYYVTTILPYLEAATKLFSEVHAKLDGEGLSGRERRQYIREREADMRSRFEDRVKGLNETQGVLLIKLIGRQTGLNVYQSLYDFKGMAAAVKWQAWARLHGFNLNRKYHPEEEPDLERIMRSLGYPLPAFYGGSGEED